MNATTKALIVALRYTQGERDAALGIPPKSSSPIYRSGYAHQYEREQRQTHRSMSNGIPF